MSKITVHRCDFDGSDMGNDESKHHTVSIDGGDPRDCCQRCHDWLLVTKHRMRAPKKGKRGKRERTVPPSEPPAITENLNKLDAAMEHAQGVMRAKAGL